MAMSGFKNALLAQFSEEARVALALRPCRLQLNQPVYEAHQPIETVYFMETGMVSVVGELEDGRSIEVGTIGRESMTGTVLVLETDVVPYRHFVQVEGSGYVTSAERLLEVVASNPDVRRAVCHAEAAFHAQSMQNAVCNGMHNVEQRCCRWILMTRDRVDSDELKLSHEFLGLMLGCGGPASRTCWLRFKKPEFSNQCAARFRL